METERLDDFYRIQSRFYDLTRPFFLLDRKRALSSIQFNRRDQVLDLACGTGMNIPYISSVVDRDNITGIDYSESMLKKARHKFPDMNFVRADVSDFEFNMRFDKIVCTYSLSMIDRWRETIQNARDHLSQNGLFLILDFNRWDRFRPLYSPFRRWLNIHGVDPEKDYVSELSGNFQGIDRHVLNLGYNQLIIAHRNI